MKNKTDKSQSERFIEIARKLGCDEDEAAFEERLRKIGKAKPEDVKKPGKKGRK